MMSPEERYRYLRANGTDAYNRMMREQFDRDTVATANGYGIRRVDSRFGTLYMVEGTSSAFRTVDEAVNFANAQPVDSAPSRRD